MAEPGVEPIPSRIGSPWQVPQRNTQGLPPESHFEGRRAALVACNLDIYWSSRPKTDLLRHRIRSLSIIRLELADSDTDVCKSKSKATILPMPRGLPT